MGKESLKNDYKQYKHHFLAYRDSNAEFKSSSFMLNFFTNKNTRLKSCWMERKPVVLEQSEFDLQQNVNTIRTLSIFGLSEFRLENKKKVLAIECSSTGWKRSFEVFIEEMQKVV